MNVGNHVIWNRVLEQNPQPNQQDRLGTYESNIDVCSRNNFCPTKTRNIAYSECLSVHKAHHAPYYIFICGLCGCT